MRAIISIVWNIYRECIVSFLLTTSYVTSTCSTLIFSISLVFEISFFSLSPGIATSFRNHLLEGRGTRASIMQEPGSVRGNHPDLYDFSSYSTSSRILHPGILHSIVTNFILLIIFPSSLFIYLSRVPFIVTLKIITFINFQKLPTFVSERNIALYKSIYYYLLKLNLLKSVHFKPETIYHSSIPFSEINKNKSTSNRRIKKKRKDARN